MSVTAWTWDLTAVRMVFAAVFLALNLVLSVLLHRRAGGARASAAVESLRVVLAILLAVTLLRPERVHRVMSGERPGLRIRYDASGSMATEDVVQDGGPLLARAAWVSARIEERFWAGLEDRFEVDVERFPPADREERGTDLHRAIDEATRVEPAPRAVLLISDGDWNEGPPPVLAAADARSRGIPVYTVTVGHDRHLPDLDLASVVAPSFALVEETLAIPFSVWNRFDREIRVTAEVRTEDGAVVARRSLLLPPQGRTVAEAILPSPRDPASVSYSLSVPVQPGEVRDDNNARAFRIDWRRERIRVLVIDTEPRWEYRFLRNALVRDPGVAVDVLLLHPELGPAEGLHYLPAFPGTRAELSAYDVIFLGDVGVGPGALTAEQADRLAEVVRQQAGGLVFLPGPRGRQAALLGTELESMLPVEIREGRHAGAGHPVPARLLLTEAGRDHFLTRLASEPEVNDTVWRTLPGFHWHAAPERARPGSEVLAVHGDVRTQHGRMPLLVTRPAGQGQVLFMGTDAAWRWRRGVEDTFHYRFWGQVARWMARRRHLARTEGIRFFYQPENPGVGDRVYFHATAFDVDGAPLERGDVEIEAAGPGGTYTFRLSPEPGGWGVYTGTWRPPAAGRFTVRATVAGTGRSVETEVLVTGAVLEAVGQPARPAVMDEIARVSGGASVRAAAMDELLARIDALPQSAPREERLRLWAHPFWVGTVLLVAAAYWVGRKLLGRI